MSSSPGRLIFLALALGFTVTLSHAAPADEDSKDEGGKAPEAQNLASGAVKDLPNYKVEAIPANIAVTPLTQPRDDIKVIGEPRNSVGHPCTLVDKEDIDALKKQIKTNAEAKKALEDLQKTADDLLAKPIAIPVAQKGADGQWLAPSEMPNIRAHVIEASSKGMVVLGMMYQLSGDSKYGAACKKMVMDYADNFPNYGHPKGWTPQKLRSAKDERLNRQFLTDGIWLCRVAFAYDLVHELPSWTPEEHAHVLKDLLRPVSLIFHNPDNEKNYMSALHNRSAVCVSGVLMAGYASEDPTMINEALYGIGGTKEKPTGGLLKVHFGEGITADGLWIEGAPGYQIGIASCGLFNDAETLWHHGIDLYRFRGGIVKRMLDSAIALSYPDENMTLAKLHDSQGGALIGGEDWHSNEVGVPYECGYRRYQDPAYLPIISKAHQTFTMTEHGGGPSLFLTLPETKTETARPLDDANYYAVGYGVLRTPNPTGNSNQLILEYGPSGGHAHPSKLGIDLFTLGTPALPLPGVIFPYGDPLDVNWFITTVANCVMIVDEKSQNYSKSKNKKEIAAPPVANQAVFAPAALMGMQKAWSTTVHPGVTQDRSLFMTPEYMADIYGGFSDAPHTFDLAWHARGKMTTSLKTEPFQFPAPVVEGYNSIDNLTRASTDKAWTASVTTPTNKPLRVVAAGGTATDVFVGTGHYMTDHVDEHPPMFLQRRTGANEALFGNAVDFSGGESAYVKSVSQEGSLTAGYGLLKVETTKGTDLCFTAFRPGTYSAGGLDTDAMQAFVKMDGTNVQAMNLGGGTSLKVKGGEIARSEPGLAYVEKSADGKYIVANPSSTEATVTVALPALAGMKSFNLDSDGKRTEAATVEVGSGAGSFKVKLKPMSRVEFGAS